MKNILSYTEFASMPVIMVIHMYDPVSDTLTFNLGHMANVIGRRHNDEDLLDTFRQNRDKIKAIVIGGSRLSPLKEEKDHTLPEEILDSGKPILGICYGYELFMKSAGAKLKRMKIAEKMVVQARLKKVPLFNGLSQDTAVYMNHDIMVTEVPTGYEKIAETDRTPYAGLQNVEKKFWGVQFHPEKTWIDEIIFKNFLDIIKDL